MTGTIKAWLLLGGIFVVGAITGSALTIGFGSHFIHQPGPPPQIQHLWMMQLVKQLKLTPDQKAKIRPILADAQAKIQSLQHEQIERGSQIFKEAHQQIAAILTPEQRVELQQLESEREEMFSNRMRPWGHEGQGGQFGPRGPLGPGGQFGPGNGPPGGAPGQGGGFFPNGPFRGGGSGNMSPYAPPGGGVMPVPPPPPPLNASTNDAPPPQIP
jgi:Spy/CpxP family protein refolding chaperone